jgi:hypothetical protein
MQTMAYFSVLWTKTGYEKYMEKYKDKVPLSIFYYWK